MLLNPKPLTSKTANVAKVERPKVVDARVAKFKEYDYLLIKSKTLR